MNENPLGNLPADAEPSLPCGTIVYRAALEATWLSLEKDQVDAHAFFKRGKHDSHGLSVTLTEYGYREYLSGPVAGVISFMSDTCVIYVTLS